MRVRYFFLMHTFTVSANAQLVVGINNNSKWAVLNEEMWQIHKSYQSWSGELAVPNNQTDIFFSEIVESLFEIFSCIFEKVKCVKWLVLKYRYLKPILNFLTHFCFTFWIFFVELEMELSATFSSARFFHKIL